MKKRIAITVTVFLLVGASIFWFAILRPQLLSNQTYALMMAVVRDGNVQTIKAQLDAGGDVNTTDDAGRSLIFFAIYRGHKEITELLIEKGADLKAKQSAHGAVTHIHDPYSEETPLDFAIRLKHKEIADLLRKHGAKTREEVEVEGK